MLVDNAGFSCARCPNVWYTNVPLGGCNMGCCRLISPNELCRDAAKEI